MREQNRKQTMFKTSCLFLLIGLLAGCAPHTVRQSSAPLSSPNNAPIWTTQYRQVTAFNNTDIQGTINVTLHTGYKHPQVVLKGDARDLAQVKTIVSLNTLYISLGKGFPQHGLVTADIRSATLNSIRYIGKGQLSGNRINSNDLNVFLINPGTTKLSGHIRLRQLEVNGSGFVQISGLASPYLNVHLKGNPKVQLSGIAKAGTIILNGDAWLSLYWIKSEYLTIKAKKGARFQLAGSANVLDLELWDKAYFKGRYLRADRSFVKTHGHAIAEIASVKHQSNLATDASNIYYYNLPDTRADFMAFNGSVLDMREWSQPELKDFTRYNKQFP